jgi:hypothetical protein
MSGGVGLALVLVRKLAAPQGYLLLLSIHIGVMDARILQPAFLPIISSQPRYPMR